MQYVPRTMQWHVSQMQRDDDDDVDEELEGLYKVDVVMRMQVDVDIF